MLEKVGQNFSVYQLVERAEKVGTALNHRQTMNHISYEIENATLIDSAPNYIFSGFQVMSKFLPQVARYRKIAAKAKAVYVFGVRDVQPPVIPNIHYVYLEPDDRLAQEWFLISYSDTFVSALATEEVTTLNDPDAQRQFKGVWTFDPGMCGILTRWIKSEIDAQIDLSEDNLLQGKQHQRYVENINSRMMGRITTKARGHIREELQSIVLTVFSQNTAFPQK